ncbi:MAG: pyrimidine 5'-nucleotidase [Anaerolineales bacterium]|nr:pyrimidine 5'-nucleotidase [Anaerolineales bacterium]
MNFDTIFFDLDSTLYPESCGLWQAIRERIDLYLQVRMGFAHGEIPAIRQGFFIRHGTTLRGLQAHYEVDPVDYLNFVHDLPLAAYLAPDPELRQMLLSIPYRRWVFTNADASHANRVMDILGIRDCFEGMIDVWAMDPLCKPQEAAYTFAMDYAGVKDPKACALLDDSVSNLAPAKKLGFYTVLVGENGSHSAAHRSLVDIHSLPEVVPEFWR